MSIILLSVFLIIYFNNKKNVFKEDNTKSELFSYMIETSAGSGDYEMVTDNKWLGEGYVFNESLSGCENGSKLTWNDETTAAFYGYERGTTVYSGRPTSTTGYISLMYPSDYGYSVLASSCARTTNLGSYNNSTCAGESWLYGSGYEWTITPISSSRSNMWHVNYNGNLRSNNVSFGFVARSVLYLDSNVYVVDGSGTMTDPYIIGMNNDNL